MSHPLALRLTATAERDLAEIWAYLATEASEAIATRFVAGVEAAFEPIQHYPFVGPQRDQLAPGLRVTFYDRYAIYYRPLADAIVIIRVLHGARDAAALADHGRFAG